MDPATNRLLTVPNVISFVRLCCIPVFVYLVFGLEREALAAVVLGVLGATDWIDGYIARRWHQVSAVGKFVDPAADRLLLAVATVTLIVRDAVPLWFASAALLREGLIIVGGIYLVSKGIRGLDVEYIGKAGAFGLMFSLPFFLLAHSGESGRDIWLAVAWVCGIPGLVLSYISAAHYLRRARIKLRLQNDRHKHDRHKTNSDENGRDERAHVR